ncbi:MAG: deoxyribonuclease IV [Spirochaetales bacterium]|nr:deoxyribonuclease IV [Spirochaetales bacterium]MCF7939407.1 deoxyribonuclease IV [Spirochaetales bacterium]
MNDILLGPHISAAGGVSNAPCRAAKIGATAFALFVKNQKRWAARHPLSEEEIGAFESACREHNFPVSSILPHAGYLINIASPKTELRQRSVRSFIEESLRCSLLGLTMINIHPGSHTGLTDETGAVALAAEAVRQVLEAVPGIAIVLENTAGQGTAMGARFEHLRDILGKVGRPDRTGVCIDTCHLHAAGWDLGTEAGYNRALEDFKHILGFETLRGLHLNDAKQPAGSRKDRHAGIGQGTIGTEGFARIIRDYRSGRIPRVPMILETPDPHRWEEEIKTLKAI